MSRCPLYHTCPWAQANSQRGKQHQLTPNVTLPHHPSRHQGLLRLLLQLLRSEEPDLCGNLLSSGKVSVPAQETYIVLVNSPEQQSITVRQNH